MHYPNPLFNYNPHDRVDRTSIYNAVAVAYDRVRPRYPEEFISTAIELAQLPNNAQILEIGCGTGVATVAFARRGYSLVAVEPSLEMCRVARENCQEFPQVKIEHTLFENWELTPEKFDAVLAATSFHWVSVDVAYAKTAAALKENGVLILLWNVVPHPPLEIFQLLQPVYQTHAPSLANYQDLATEIESIDRFERQIIDSGYFEDVISDSLTYEINYSVDDYLMLLTTLSPYIRLTTIQRQKLAVDLRQVLEQNLPNGVPLTHPAIVQVARKVSRP